jgi:hypothetical protein
MIYQLYPNEQYVSEPFSEYYSNICLDCLNEEYLPQLKMEYSGMLYLWNNNLDSDEWIGFTSYRQQDKSKFILNKENINSIIPLLTQYDILCFLHLKLHTTISIQAEQYHKGINENMKYLFKEFYNETIPESFYTDNCGCFANYWIMSKKNFNSFMAWSYLKVLKMIELSKTNKYFALDQHKSNPGFIIERLFIVWYMKYNKSLYSIYDQQ